MFRARRVILMVMDGCGVGALPDAPEYGEFDSRSNTLGHVASTQTLTIPTLESLGLGNITPMRGIAQVKRTLGGWGKCAELSKGKDSVTGHWEMMGIVTDAPFPTYPNGFPSKLIAEFEDQIGRKILGNIPSSGTEIIKTLGVQHIQTGYPIVYTSADSVFQVAAHEDVIPLYQLYEFCEIARQMLVSPDNVQRVIARPFTGNKSDGFTRTGNRRDFPLQPTEPNDLTRLRDDGIKTHAIGVIADLFPRDYFAVAQRTQSNAEHLSAINKAIDENKSDFIFANCEDFDMFYGHRNDSAGFARELNNFDQELGKIINKLKPSDLLIITADHGNDPTIASTDHSREYIPLLAVGNGIEPGTEFETCASFSRIGALVCQALSVKT